MRKFLLLFLLLLFLSHFLYAQSITISGIVKDTKGELVIGATVSEKGTSNRSVTVGSGQFVLSVQQLPTTLVITGIGFQRQEVSVKSNDFVHVVLHDQNAALDEVVIIGHQSQSLKKTTSSVQVISGDVIANLPAPSFETLLKGRVSGVNIQSFTGEPGARNTFTVRGNSTISADLSTEVDLANTMSSPLYIIDGMPMSVSDLAASTATGTNYVAGINISDIESITIQKDAAATAVWGSRGANGVIVIKTKTGKSGKPQIRVSYYKGITARPNLQRTLLGATERRVKINIISQYVKDYQLNNLTQPLTDSLNTSYNNAVDWQDLFYTTGNIDNVDLSIAGGSDAVNYRLSLGYYDEGGIVRQTGFKRYSLRGNFGFKLAPFLRSDFVVSTSRVARKVGLGRGTDQAVPIDQGSMPSSFVQLGQEDYDFYFGVYDKVIDDNKTDIVNLFSKTYVDITKGLQYSFEGSVQANLDSRNQFQPRELSPDGVNWASSRSSNSYTYNLANVLNYNKSFGDHNFVLTALQSFQYDNIRDFYLMGTNIPTDNIHVVQGVLSKNMRGSTDVKSSGLLSFSGQFAYDYKGKYILNASYRGDGSSRFGKNSKWGYFPSFSGAWVISDEEFMKGVSLIDFFKIRASWGKSGILPSDFYAPFNVWDVPSRTYDGQAVATPSFARSLTLPNLTWNKSEQTNIGFDLNILQSRLTFVVDAYRKVNTSPILSFPFPFYTGYTRLSYNVPMSIYNEGIDVSINTRNMSKEKSFQWNTNFNLSYNINRIGSLPNDNRAFYAESRFNEQQLLYSVGSAIYQWAQIPYQGVYNHLEDIPINPITGKRVTYFKGNRVVLPGFPKWQDVDGDWDVWTGQDRGSSDGDLILTGNPNPKFTGGLFNEFFYKNFSLGVLATFTLGRDIINTFRSAQFADINASIYKFTNNRLPDLKGIDYWTPEKAKDPNYRASFPSINPAGPNFYQFSPFTTMWNENGSFLKIQTVSFGYLMPESLLKRVNIGVKTFRIYGSLDNLFTFQSASVPDAELVTPQGEYSGYGYPLPRKFTIGVEVTF